MAALIKVTSFNVERRIFGMLKLRKETPGIQGGDHDDLEVLNKEFEKSEPENPVIASTTSNPCVWHRRRTAEQSDRSSSRDHFDILGDGNKASRRCPDSGPRATRMPTDDDYGRRERLLLHQHPGSQCGASAPTSLPGNSSGISSSQCASSIAVSGANSITQSDCYHKQRQQQSESRAPSSTTIIQERYSTTGGNTGGSSDRIQTNETNDYGVRVSMEKYEKQSAKQHLDEVSIDGDQSRSISSCCERYGMSHSHERFSQSSGCTSTSQSNHSYPRQQQQQQQQQPQQQQQQQSQMSQSGIVQYSRYNEATSSTSVEQRLPIQSSDCFQHIDHFQNDKNIGLPSKTTVVNEYANSGILALSSGKQFSQETFPSPPSPAPTNDHFVPPPPLSPSQSEKYASTPSLAGYSSNDRIMPPSSPCTRDRYGTAPASPMSKDRFMSADRLLAVDISSINHTNHDVKDQQQRYGTSTERLLANGSPVLGTLQRDSVSLFQSPSANKDLSRYTLSSELLVTSSPIHAPVPERFASKTNDRFISNSPIHDRYHRSESIHHDRFSTIASCERYLANSPNPDATHQRYSSTERVLNGTAETGQSRRYSSSERGVECQKYSERNDRCSNSSSPTPNDYTCRYSGFQDVSDRSRYSSDRFSDITLQRYTQSRTNDRFGDRYFANSSPTHDTRINSEINKYTSASSTERLLVSSSPSSSENSRYHNIYSTSGQNSNDCYIQSSSTPENNGTLRAYQNQTATKNDKFIQVSKSANNYGRYQLSNHDRYERASQERVYGIERYGTTANSGDRYQGSEQRYHGNPERYSPGRGVGEKYLSLPKPKDTYSTGRIASSCSPVDTGNEGRSYGTSVSGVGSYVPPNAHTPVERYVPQPPPEVLYPERYVDRYVPPVAHTPTDRYVPTADPGDPYMRRDLGFHHHYRLPPPGYLYHQSHFRFRGFAYASPGRLGGSPGSSSSSSSTSVQREFSTSPLLRPKVRASAIEFTSTSRSNQSCCGDGTGGQRNSCCQVRRSLPPGALPTIPTNHSAHSS
ncbi:hypothetical protein PV327_002538, partial [Microctonus hyperodae]